MTADSLAGFQSFTGEDISIGVAISWTITALCFEYAGKRVGTLPLNIIRLLMAIGMLALTLYFFTGNLFPFDAGPEAWFWLSVSGFIGYVLGDYCLFNSYVLIGSRFGQLFMTLAPILILLPACFIFKQKVTLKEIIGAVISVCGVSLFFV